MFPVSGALQLKISEAIALWPMASASGAYSRTDSPAPSRASGRKKFQRPSARASAGRAEDFLFDGGDALGDEGTDAFLEVGGAGGEREVHLLGAPFAIAGVGCSSILEANVRKNKHLAATVAVAMTVAALAGTSAFAESRHSQETRRAGDARETVRRERSSATARSDGSQNYEHRQSADSGARSERRHATAESYRRDAARESRTERREATAETYRREAAHESYRRDDRGGSRGTYDRNRGSHRNGGYDRGGSRGTYDRNPGSHRNGGYDRNRGYDRNHGYGSRYGGYSNGGRAYYHSGRITHYGRYGNGYRVWVAGAPYPFYIPLSHWRHDRFRIGLMINLGGYWNPGGYYDYYDNYYDGYSYRSTSRGDLRGVVESVDWGRDTFVVRNEATGSYVTVIARDRNARDLRPGDYVELSGTWTRSGLFSAYDVDLLDYDRDRW